MVILSCWIAQLRLFSITVTLMFLLGICQYSIRSTWSSPMYCWALSAALAKQMTLFQKLVQLPLDLAKYRMPQVQYGEFICPTVFSFCRYKDSTWGNAYWPRVMILSCMEFSLHVFWEKSAGSLSRRGVNIKIKGLWLSSSRCIELDPLLSASFCIWMCSP